MRCFIAILIFLYNRLPGKNITESNMGNKMVMDGMQRDLTLDLEFSSFSNNETIHPSEKYYKLRSLADQAEGIGTVLCL